MTRKELLDNLYNVRHEYTWSNIRKIRHQLMHELDYMLYFPKCFACRQNLQLEIPRKIKFSCRYKRKDIIWLFSKLGLKVTRYTNEYGKTIVHFEPLSD